MARKQNDAQEAYEANLRQVWKVAPAAARAIVQELIDQRANVKLIASENYSSLAVQAAMGNLLTDKYAEGFPAHRFYAGCDNVDAIESLAVAQAKKLFGAAHAYVQPHSGADANLVAFWAILTARVQVPALAKLGIENPLDLSHEQWERVRAELGNQRLLGPSMFSGGHLTHTYRWNVSGKMFEAFSYDVSKKTGLFDYDEIATQAKKVKPFIFLAGYSAYPRKINFKILRAIADSVGAVLMVDMAHFAGLVAGKVWTGDFDPVRHAQVVTTTTHKTLRGPRGGMVLCTEEFAESVDKGCPLILGGPLPHVMAAKAVALTEALRPSFKTYSKKIVENAQALASALQREGLTALTGGTDNHLLLLDVRPHSLTGRQAESALRACSLTLNRNTIPFDPNGAWYTSGIRLGTPAVTTLGMSVGDMRELAGVIASVLAGAAPDPKSKAKYTLDPKVERDARARVARLLGRYPVYPELDLDKLKAIVRIKSR